MNVFSLRTQILHCVDISADKNYSKSRLNVVMEIESMTCPDIVVKHENGGLKLGGIRNLNNIAYIKGLIPFQGY